MSPKLCFSLNIKKQTIYISDWNFHLLKKVCKKMNFCASIRLWMGFGRVFVRGGSHRLYSPAKKINETKDGIEAGKPFHPYRMQSYCIWIKLLYLSFTSAGSFGWKQGLRSLSCWLFFKRYTTHLLRQNVERGNIAKSAARPKNNVIHI